MTITIKNKEIVLKHTLRSMIMFENITEKSFNPEGLSDLITFFYCVVVASSKDYTITFDDFLDWCDETPDCVSQFSEWLMTTVAVNDKLKKD